ncbi:MAG: hypothetical protein NT147_01360 [Candidatus Aminicenantes bacterium]|nr:hypothetical protein [Candidatus Aminicenantes bacterium]
MNRKVTVVAAVLAACLVLALPAPGQVKVKYGGYLSFEYIDGQTESLYPKASIQNLLAGFAAAGLVGGKFGFSLEARTMGTPEAGAANAWAFELDQAWAGFVPSKAINAKAGLFIVPFGTYNLASRPHETLLIGVPLNLEYLYPRTWRDIGLLIEGEVGVLSYAAYLGNGLGDLDGIGSGQQFRDNNADKAKGGRIGLALGEYGRAGISYYTGKYDERDMYDLILEGADLAWATGQWEIHGEYSKAMIENPEPFQTGKSEGYSIWMAMGFRSFQPIGSFQKVKVDDPYRDGLLRDQSRWTLGLRYVVGPTFFIKAEYVWNKEKEPILKNNQLQVQAALSF